MDEFAFSHIRQVIRKRDFLVLDTETTGLESDSEICQIGVLDPYGKVLMDKLIKPTKPIPPAATKIHGITNADVDLAPGIGAVYMQLLGLLAGRDVIIYNAKYDRRLLRQSFDAAEVDVYLPEGMKAPRYWCAMHFYAQVRGDWNLQTGDYRWHSLENAARQQGINVRDLHSAIGDCRLTLALLLKLEQNEFTA